MSKKPRRRNQAPVERVDIIEMKDPIKGFDRGLAESGGEIITAADITPDDRRIFRHWPWGQFTELDALSPAARGARRIIKRLHGTNN